MDGLADGFFECSMQKTDYAGPLWLFGYMQCRAAHSLPDKEPREN